MEITEPAQVYLLSRKMAAVWEKNFRNSDRSETSVTVLILCLRWSIVEKVNE